MEARKEEKSKEGRKGRSKKERRKGMEIKREDVVVPTGLWALIN